MDEATNKKLNKDICNLLNKMAGEHLKQGESERYRIKVCNNQFCIENSKDITGYLKGKRKNIPICAFRNFCPDAHYRYFDYKTEFIKKGGEKNVSRKRNDKGKRENDNSKRKDQPAL